MILAVIVLIAGGALAGALWGWIDMTRDLGASDAAPTEYDAADTGKQRPAPDYHSIGSSSMESTRLG